MTGFKELRTENYYYVDKTPFVKQLVEGARIKACVVFRDEATFSRMGREKANVLPLPV